MQLIHGLRVRSDPTLPGLADAVGDAPADVVVHVVRGPLADPGQPVRVRYATPATDAADATVRVVDGADGLVSFRYGDDTAFDVTLGDPTTRIEATIAPGQTLEDMAAYLYGAVLGFVLRMRGTLALHGSCVSIGGSAVVLAGGSGVGKSTTAAALAMRGHTVLSDDLTALTRTASGWVAHPAFRHVRLWPASERIVMGETGVLEQITPGWAKLRLPLDGDAFATSPTTLGAIYLLGDRVEDDGAPRLANESSRELLLSLATTTYANYLLDEPARATELRQLGELIRTVPVRVLVPHRDPARLDALCDLLVAQAERALAS